MTDCFNENFAKFPCLFSFFQQKLWVSQWNFGDCAVLYSMVTETAMLNCLLTKTTVVLPVCS